MTFRTTLVTWLISVFLKAARRCLELSLWPKARHMVLIKNCDHPRPTSQPIFLYSVLSYYLHSPLSPDFRLSPILTSFSLRNNCPIFHSEKGKPLEDTPSSSAINFVPMLSIVVVEKPIRYPIPVGLHKCANPISPVSGPSLHRALVLPPASLASPSWLASFHLHAVCSSIAYLFLPSSAQLSLAVVLYTQLDASKLFIT